MQDLSITQEYFICALNEKGRISGLSTEKLVCLVAAGLLEMQLENCITINKKEVNVTGELPAGRDYLKPLYDYINQSKAVKIEKIMEAYNYSFTDKRLDELVGAIGNSLTMLGLVETAQAGLLGGKKSYIPKKNTINGVIDMVRAELLENGEVTDDVAALVVLLDKSKSINKYFSEFERKEINTKLTAIINSPNGNMVKSMVEHVNNMISIMLVLMVAYS